LLLVILPVYETKNDSAATPWNYIFARRGGDKMLAIVNQSNTEF
jgi:hypothetical protein